MDAAVDVEPAIIKQTNSTGSGTIIVHMKYDTNGLSNFYYYTTANGNAPAKLDPPAYYTQTGDPFLTESQLDSGQSQRRVYLTGLVTNFPFTWAVAVWHSDNLGQSWTLGTNLLAAGTSDLDKPTCDVSHHSGSAGYLFVAYRKILYGTTHEIHVARSTDGGNSFDQDVVVASSTNVLNVANVVVSSSSGYVYVNWVDFSANPQKLYLARSQYAGSLSGTWTPDSSGPTGYFFVNTGDYMNGNLRGMTVPMMRHNWPAGKLSLVWHEKEASGSHLADVYYAAYTTSGWQSKVKISNESPNCGSSHTDQFMPALDHDSNGDVLVTYYDRQNNCSNSEYRLYFTKITSSGSQLQAPTDARAVRPRRLSRGVTTNVPM